MDESIYRHAQSMAIIPPKLPFAPEEAADKPAKRATMPVAVIWRGYEECFLIPETALTMPNLRPSLSEIQPKINIPTNMPRNDNQSTERYEKQGGMNPRS